MVRTMWTWRYLDPVTKHSIPNATRITNVGSFVHKVVPYKHARREMVSQLQVLFSIKGLTPKFWKLQIRKSNLACKSLHGNATRVQYHCANFECTVARSYSLASVVLQNRCVLDTAQ